MALPTHVERSEALMDEAIDLARRGATVDVDVVEKDLPKWVRYYRAKGGPADRLTVSTDASLAPPRQLLDQLRACLDAGLALADVLKLDRKGKLPAGADADVAALVAGSFELVAGGWCGTAARRWATRGFARARANRARAPQGRG